MLKERTAEETLRGKGVIFRLLSLCFFEPESETREILKNLREHVGVFFPEYLDKADQLISVFGVSDDELLQRKVEYAKLFIGPADKLAAPYGSVYLEKGLLMGESTLAVQRHYDMFGLKLEVKDMPDHIAVELEFMHYLACLNDKAVDNEAVMNDFASSFVLPWIGLFTTKIKETEHSRFYGLLAEFTAEISAKTVKEAV